MRTLCRLLCCSLFIVTTATNADEVDRAEVDRRGDMVVQVGGGFRSESDRAVGNALTTPADDSNRWFITLIECANCSHCVRFKQDLRTAPELKAWVNVRDPKQSWAHFNAYDAADKVQSWRFANIKISAYPTILVQPPRNGRYGDPSTVVYQQTGYSGAADFVTRMRAAIVTYVQKQPSVSTPQPGYRGDDSAHAQVEQSPPFQPYTPAQTPLDLPIQIPPPLSQPTMPPTPGLGLLISLLFGSLGGNGITNALLVALVGLQIYRHYRQVKGLPLLLDDATFQKLLETLNGKLTTPNESPSVKKR